MAFSASSVMVPAFKNGNNYNLSEDPKYFNSKLAKVQFKSKHCIGLHKARLWTPRLWTPTGYSNQV